MSQLRITCLKANVLYINPDYVGPWANCYSNGLGEKCPKRSDLLPDVW